VRALLVALVAVALFLCALTVQIGPPESHAGMMTSGDSALAAAGTFKIYPFFTNGGAHIHNSQWVADAQGNLLNGYQQATSGYIYSSLSALRVNTFGPSGVDSSGYTIPAGGTQTAIPSCDSITVLNVGGTATTVTWGLYK
jgi:hypothetical protein